MTFSIIARNPKTGEIGGAAATGNLCVGGWVLRGDIKKGITTSQGFYPSTVWGENILINLNKFSPAVASNKIIKKDRNKNYRQFSCMNKFGKGFSFTGNKNIKFYDQIVLPNLVISGNMLSNNKIVAQIAKNFSLKNKSLSQSLIDALKIGKKYGSDKRGLMSAAILVLNENKPPINIRVDYDINPISKLEKILKMTNRPNYKNWLRKLPTNKKQYK